MDGEYYLKLADGQEWLVTADEAARPLAEQLAAVMRLERRAAADGKKIIFARSDHGDRRVKDEAVYCDFTIMRILHYNGSGFVCQTVDYGSEDVKILQEALSLYPIYGSAISRGGMPMHAALIEREGKGVLLAARGSTGKSTCCRRVPAPWHALCDDESLIVMDDRKNYRVHPFPTWSEYYWKTSEKKWDVQEHVALSAIMFLEQAKADSIVPIGPGKAALSIYEASLQACARFIKSPCVDRDMYKTRLFSNACEVAARVPAFILGVSLDGRFWDEIEQATGITHETDE